MAIWCLWILCPLIICYVLSSFFLRRQENLYWAGTAYGVLGTILIGECQQYCNLAMYIITNAYDILNDFLYYTVVGCGYVT